MRCPGATGATPGATPDLPNGAGEHQTNIHNRGADKQMNFRSELQAKTVRDLRSLARKAGVEANGLQKAKLIEAIMSTVSPEELGSLMASLPGPAIAVAEDRTDLRQAEAPDGPPDWEEERGGPEEPPARRLERPERRPAREFREQDDRRRRPRPNQRPEVPLEEREGILDTLPEGYGFLRCTGYLPGDRDVYVSAGQIRKFGLRKGDMIRGPVRSPRSQEKFPALIRIETSNEMTVEDAAAAPSSPN